MHLTKIKPEFYKQYLDKKGACRCSFLEQKFGRPAMEYISRFADLSDPGTEVLVTAEKINVEILDENILHTFINLKRINDLEEPNEFFSQVNGKLPRSGYFIGCVETLAGRKRRIMQKYPPLVSNIYYMLDFILKRVFPKLRPTRRIYRVLTRGINRVLSLTEALGRLAFCGFEVVDYREIGYLTYFVCKKVKEAPAGEDKDYGIVIGLPRVGKGGELVDVYKLRTMHPYAEYLQKYVCSANSICDNGKFNGDFRVTSWGRFLRKYWVDEQPMWFNWVRRELKLVGVRPLSEQYFSLYPEEFRKRRIKYQPGLIPPFYRDLPQTLEEIVASEQRYLDAYDKAPLLTDFRYFWMAIFNIFIKKARSA